MDNSSQSPFSLKYRVVDKAEEKLRAEKMAKFKLACKSGATSFQFEVVHCTLL